VLLTIALPFFGQAEQASAADKPNIIVVMGDDIGWFNIGAYNRGIMGGRTPSIDKVAAEGVMFTDYYAEASCTAGRANFITGQIPLRTGLTTVGQAGSDIGMPAESPTIATALKEQGYATGQFGKNHLGDLNKYLPCVHGFDEYFGWLYHLDAMQDPFNRTYPPELRDTVGPRNLVHCEATEKADSTVDPRWGKVGKQKITDEGPLPPGPKGSSGLTWTTEGHDFKYDQTMIDQEVTRRSIAFMDKSVRAGKPFFLWVNPARMHVYTHLSDKYADTINPKNQWTIQEAGMREFDDVVGALMAALDRNGIADNTLIAVTTDNGAEVFSWPDGGMTPFRGTKGMVTEGGFRVPMVMRWPGKIKPGTVSNEIVSGLDWFPTFVAAAGGPQDIAGDLRRGAKLDGKKYKVHLDGYNQLDLLTKEAPSKRNEIWYFGEATLGAARVGDVKYIFLDQPQGWFGSKVELDWPKLVNLRLDPFERCIDFPKCPSAMMDWWAHEFWRFTFVQKEVTKFAKTFIDFPPQQAPASFNLDQVKAKIQQMRDKVKAGSVAR
jgi:arylsulfatase A-like enzyme